MSPDRRVPWGWSVSFTPVVNAKDADEIRWFEAEKRRAGSQPEPASDLVQGDIVAGFRTGQIQLGRSLGVEDFLLTQFR